CGAATLAVDRRGAGGASGDARDDAVPHRPIERRRTGVAAAEAAHRCVAIRDLSWSASTRNRRIRGSESLLADWEKMRRNGAQKRTRTSTPLRAPAPEAGASTNSAIWAPDRRGRT